MALYAFYRLILNIIRLYLYLFQPNSVLRDIIRKFQVNLNQDYILNITYGYLIVILQVKQSSEHFM